MSNLEHARFSVLDVSAIVASNLMLIYFMETGVHITLILAQNEALCNNSLFLTRSRPSVL